MYLSPRLRIGLAGLLLSLSLSAADAPNPKLPTTNAKPGNWPGRQADGSVLLPNMWSLRPAGKQVDLADFPVNIAVHPDGKFAVILHAGYSPHELAVVEIGKATVAGRTKIEEAFYGVEFSRDGKRLYASGAGSETVRCFDFDAKTGTLGKEQEIRLRAVTERGIPAGLALTSDAQHLYVANVLGQRVAKVDLTAKTNVLDIIVGPGGTTPNSKLQTPNSSKPQTEDEAAITKRAEAALDPADPTAPYPYACRLDEKKGRLYVSLWAQAQVAVIDLKSNQVLARWPTEDHPNEMVLTKNGQLLYVANANRNTVTVIDTETGLTTETIWAALHPQSPPGATPNSLALTPDEKILFVANANINTLAVVDVSTRGKSRPLGFIPTGWYPTSVRVTPDGKKLLIANGKGIISKANPNGPQPGKKAAPGTTSEYIAGLFKGTLSVIDLPKRADFEKQLEKYTATAYQCSPLKADNSIATARPADSPIPGKLGEAGPIKYCIYIVKENRTYDQVFGDMKQGNGDAKLCIFPERVTPNHHKLVQEFVLLDNFYVESEVSADGHEWSMAAYATDYVEKFWPLSYGHNKTKKYTYPAEGNFPIATPAGGYLWDVAAAAKVSFRSYGEFVQNAKKAGDPATARLKTLQGRFDPLYRGFDMDYTDVKRAERFISELKRFEGEGEMPRLQVVRLPSDHTSGTSLGKHTPTAAMADNDLGLGLVVEAVSKSKFWAQTAIFVVEDDAQNGPDHVDAHRTVALVVSPYTKRGVVDSTMYSTSSMLRTMELILGMRPMSQFDAAATPMFNSFQPQADVRPYTALPANVDLNERNGKLAWGVEKSRKMDFTKEDAADDLQLNEIIWRSVRGPTSKMPAPVRAAFVFPHAAKDDDDD
ncbi:MAG: YncE family protein [Proteobacteria bacterium]|nr:YncE family protein [Pseudomonadota bacterium]